MSDLECVGLLTRPLLCGHQVAYPGHQTLTETISIPYGPDRYAALQHDFRLQRLSSTTPADLAATGTSSSHLEGGGAVTRPTWAGLGISLMVVLHSLMN